MAADATMVQLAQRLALSLPQRERDAFKVIQIRLAKVLAQLWEAYAEMLEVHRALAQAGEKVAPVHLADFRPGDTLRLGSSCARTDPRIVLADRLGLEEWQERLGDLSRAVLQAPDLARLELLSALVEVDPRVVQEVAERFGSEDEDTDEFPVRPRRGER